MPKRTADDAFLVITNYLVEELPYRYDTHTTNPQLFPIIDLCESIEKEGKTEKNTILLLKSIQKCLKRTRYDLFIVEEIVYILHIFNIDNIYI
jgi:hypothetical protein